MIRLKDRCEDFCAAKSSKFEPYAPEYCTSNYPPSALWLMSQRR
jgi:hypothetical protein